MSFVLNFVNQIYGRQNSNSILSSVRCPVIWGELERSHNQDFFDKVRTVKEYDILDEFIDAAKEEEDGLQKVIEAYDKRLMNQSLS
jgi:hypothetical protein